MREKSINTKANFFNFKRAIAFDNNEMFLTKVNVRRQKKMYGYKYDYYYSNYNG